MYCCQYIARNCYFCNRINLNNPMRPVVHHTYCKIIIGLLLLTGFAATVTAQTRNQPAQKDDYYDEGFFRYEDFIYDASIATVLFHRLGFELSGPILIFNSDEQLRLSFDQLDEDYQLWQYTVIHCDALWQPTDLWQNEYIDGFTEGYIRDYAYSYNTLQEYTHYELVFPNNEFKFTLPGNYLLKVYPEGAPDRPIITRRFMVVDQRVSIAATVKQSSVVDQYFTHQEVQFSVLNAAYPILDPRELKVVILQNDRWDNAIWGLEPLMLRHDEIDYHYTDGRNAFEGGNEFRYFDIKSLRYHSERVAAIESRRDGYLVTLLPDAPRSFKPYVTYGDINGKFLIKTEDAPNVNVEGEYVWVDFLLPYQAPFSDGGVYIIGELTQWQFTGLANAPRAAYGKAQMKYNFARQGYEARLYLKQGYYNYLYGFLPNGSAKATLALLEGSHYQTRNRYTILVYYREQGSRFDRLIGAEVINQ